MNSGHTNTISGFDYRTGRERNLSRAEWQQEVRAMGDTRRRVENGETFYSDSRGVLLVEVYTNLSA